MAIDFSKFKLFTPPPKPSQLAVNVTASGFLNLNDKLRKKILATSIDLWTNEEGTQIILNPNGKTLKILKSGSIKVESFTRELETRGIALPARFEANFDEEEQMWLGTLVRPQKLQRPITISKSKLKKPRTTGLKEMMT